MELGHKKVLLNMVYYTLIATMIAFVVFLLVSLGNATIAEWERVCFYIVIGLLVAVTIYDIICTCMRREKYIAGIILYVISIALVVLTLIVFALNASNGRLILDISERFFRIILFSYIIDAIAIAIFCIGEGLINNDEIRRMK